MNKGAANASITRVTRLPVSADRIATSFTAPNGLAINCFWLRAQV